MSFTFIIKLCIGDVCYVRGGAGHHYPHEGGFNLEDMLWQMTEQFGRPTSIDIHMTFTGGNDGQEIKQ